MFLAKNMWKQSKSGRINFPQYVQSSTCSWPRTCGNFLENRNTKMSEVLDVLAKERQNFLENWNFQEHMYLLNYITVPYCMCRLRADLYPAYWSILKGYCMICIVCTVHTTVWITTGTYVWRTVCMYCIVSNPWGASRKNGRSNHSLKEEAFVPRMHLRDHP